MRKFCEDLLKTKNRLYYAIAGATAVMVILIVINVFSTVRAYRLRRHYSSAYNHYHQRSITRTQYELNRLIKLEPRFVPAYLLAGSIAIEQKAYNEASRYFNRVVELKQPSADLLNGLGITKILSNFKEGGAIDREGLVELQRATEERGIERPGDVYVNLGNIELYEALRIRRSSPSTAEVHFANAERYFNEALRTSNVRYEGLANLYTGRAVLLVARVEKAGPMAKRSAYQQAQSDIVRAKLFNPDCSLMRQVEILLALEEASSLPLNSPERKRLHERARNIAGQADLKSLSFVAHNNLGVIALSERRFDSAYAFFDTAAALFPETALPLLNKATAGIEQARAQTNNRTLERARTAVQEAVRHRNTTQADRFILLTSLAAVEHRAKNSENALRLYELALGMADNVAGELAALVYHGFAAIYYEQGQLKEMQEMVERMLEKDPTIDDFRQIIQELRQEPHVSQPMLVTASNMPTNMQPIRATAYNRSTGELLQKEHIVVTINGRPVDFEFLDRSQIVAMPPAPLPEGRHTVRVDVVDQMGNRAEASNTIMIDSTPPEVISLTPPRGLELAAGESTIFEVTLRDELTEVNYNSIKLVVRYEPAEGSHALATNYTIINYGSFEYTKEVMAAGGGVTTDTFRFQLKNVLEPGTYTFTLDAGDVRGNAMQTRWTYSAAVKGETRR